MSELGVRIVAQARRYLGVPWFHTGRSREGLDCIGLLAVVAHDLGITDYDERNYAPEPPSDRLRRTLLRFCDPVWDWLPNDPRGEFPRLHPGDLVQFTIAGDPRHCGIYAEDQLHQPTLIHAYQSAGCVVEHAFDVHWQKRLWAAYRLKER